MQHRNNLITTILLALGCFALCPVAQAVSPAPDGGYPGGNTAEGQSSLLSLSTGTYNTAVGLYSLLAITDGKFNTGIGAGTLLANTADDNTATGAGTLLSNTTGADNTANGTFALFSNTTGVDNTGMGSGALESNTAGSFNTATGLVALALNVTGSGNTANGVTALLNNTIGNFNTANGFEALGDNDTGDGNTAIGRGALANNTAGNGNTALGANAGSALTTGNNNIDIGVDVIGAAGEANTIRIGNTNITTAYIRGISKQITAGGVAVFVDSGGHLGTMTSSARFKDEIKPMGNASEAILALRPVSFRYKKEIDPQGIPEFGLIAEQVEKVNPALVIRDEEGRPYTVRYEQINAMLLNEFLKEHRKVRQLEANAAEEQKEINLLKSELKEQRASIQSVNDKVELNKPAPQPVARIGK
jgi:Chaperone of endosialidase